MKGNIKPLVTGAVVVAAAYLTFRKGGILEQIMAGLPGGAAEGGAPMPDPYGYGGATTKPTDEIVRWTDPNPFQPDQTTPDQPKETVVNNYYYYPQDNGNPNKSSQTGQDGDTPGGGDSTPSWLNTDTVLTAAILAPTAYTLAKKVPAKDIGKRAWDVAKSGAKKIGEVVNKAPKNVKAGGAALGLLAAGAYAYDTVAGAVERKTGTPQASFGEYAKYVPLLGPGLAGVVTQVSNLFRTGTTTAPTTTAASLPATPQSTTNAFMSRAAGGQGVQTNPNRPSGSSGGSGSSSTAPAVGTAAYSQRFHTAPAAKSSSSGGSSSSSSSSGSRSSSNTGGFGLRQVGTTSSGGRVFK